MKATDIVGYERDDVWYCLECSDVDHCEEGRVGSPIFAYEAKETLDYNREFGAEAIYCDACEEAIYEDCPDEDE